MSQYRARIKEAMEMLAQDPRVYFIGQTVGYPGSRFTYGTLQDIPIEKRIEVPIAEEMQMGDSIGLALQGFIPVSIYPRSDFLLLALNQLVNHLDKIEEMSMGQYKPKVIVRTVIGSRRPLDPGPQHRNDYSTSLQGMLTNVDVIKIDSTDMVIPAYQRALESNRSSIMIELGELHN